VCFAQGGWVASFPFVNVAVTLLFLPVFVCVLVSYHAVMKLRSILLLFVAGLMAISAPAAKIKADYDKHVDFNTYKTYAWGKVNPLPRAMANLVISSAIDAELVARGLKMTDVDHADLIIRYQGSSDTDLNFARSSDPAYSQFGGIPLPDSSVWGVGFNIPTSGRYVKKGSLVVDIFDKQKHLLVWSGTVSDTLNHSPEKAIKTVNKDISDLFDRYPVKKSGNTKLIVSRTSRAV
jgi:hypothetical protein